MSIGRFGRAAAIMAVCGVGAVGLAGGCNSSSGASTSPQSLAAQISANDTTLREAIDSWRAGGDPPSTQPPEEVLGPARSLQSYVRFLATHPNLAGQTIASLPAALGKEIRELTRASRDLNRLSHGTPPRKLKTGLPPPLSELRSHYDKANRRHGIGQHYLAAIHLVETRFGRVKSNSVAGAKGPMQFIPSTWRIYGRGGNIKDPHDAILAAARLLRDRGAPGSYSRALYAYNPSKLYVHAVQRYAQVLASNPYALYFLYCWEP